MKPNSELLYPILFEPIYKEVMWGGNMMSEHLKRSVPNGKTPIGEAWEIVDRKDAQSVVENGALKGKTIRQLIETYGASFVGEKYANSKFPLLVKIIDAGQRLSLQVHPDESACRKIGSAEPKTEMWYIIAAQKDAPIFVGLNNRATRSGFLANCQTKNVEKYLQKHSSNPGDAFFINAGTVHAIGEGNLLFEVQQNSDTTYRISDWGRVDADGKSRELHLDKAIECIHFIQRSSPKITGVTGTVTHNRKFPLIQYCPFFKVDDLRIVGKWDDNTSQHGNSAFNLITPVNNAVSIQKNDQIWEIPAGRTALLPADFGTYSVISDETRETTVLKTQA